MQTTEEPNSPKAQVPFENMAQVLKIITKPMYLPVRPLGPKRDIKQHLHMLRVAWGNAQ